MRMFLGLVGLLVATCAAYSVPEAKESKLAKATNDLAFDLLRSYKDQKNVFISPFSISTALGMVYLGADGTTERAMRGVLKYNRYNLDPMDVHEAFQTLLTQVKRTSDYQLSTYNGALVQDRFIIFHMYGHAINQYYNAHIETVNFQTEGEAVKSKINADVERATNGKIKNFLSEPLSTDTKLFLLNAVYFLGNWENPFDRRATYKRSFYNNGVEEKKVPTMSRTGTYQFSYQNNLDASVVVLPYKGNSASMIVVLPKTQTGVAELEQKITQDALDEALQNSHKSSVKLVIPKFKLEYSTELKDSLSTLGLRELFSDGANLSRIAGEEADLKVTSIVHKAVIEVSENGTEAAAATGVEISNRAGLMAPSFVVDHPFLFFIREDTTGTILFSGRVDEL